MLKSVIVSIVLLAGFGQTHPLKLANAPSKEETAAIARTLVSRESLMNVNTVFQDGPHQGEPISFVEYYADCGDGNPIVLVVDISTSFRNIAAGSPSTFSIRTGDHPLGEKVDPHYPGGMVSSLLGSPRVVLRGGLVDIIDDEEIKEAKECLLERHPDADMWVPGGGGHTTHWAKLVVDDLYIIGGFGGMAYIGEIEGELYHSSKTLDSDELERFIHQNRFHNYHGAHHRDDYHEDVDNSSPFLPKLNILRTAFLGLRDMFNF